MSAELWHFTCEHGYAGLGQRGLIGLNPHLLIPELGQILWLTNDPEPRRDDVGLTSSLLSCDRMKFRYRVDDTSGCIAWMDARKLAHPAVLPALESLGKPKTWWISRRPRLAVLDNDGREMWWAA